MGILSSKMTKAKKIGHELGNKSMFGGSSTKVAIVFWRDGKTGFFIKDDTWPLIFFDSKIYEGNLGFVGVIDTPWLHDMVSTTFSDSPKGIFGAVYDPPTILLQSFCREQGYTVTFSSRKTHIGEFVLAEVEMD